MNCIDIGVNLTSKKFNGETEEILSDSFDNGIEAIIITGTSVSASKEAMNLVIKYSKYQLYYTVGIHPESANFYLGKNYTNQLRKLISNPKCVSIGETGLDFSKSFHNKEKQKQVFEEHIQLAIEFDKCLFLHEKKAGPEFIEILSKYKGLVNGVVHCYTDNKETASKLVELGLILASQVGYVIQIETRIC